METLSESTPLTAAFTNAHFEAVSGALPRYDWLNQARQNAWASYASSPYPTHKDQGFRFAAVKRVSDVGFAPAEAPSPEQTNELIARSLALPECAGRIVLVNNQPVSVELSKQAAQHGVIFLPLAEALVKHPSLVQAALSKTPHSLGADKFLALNVALCNNGAFLHVPKGLIIKEPFVICHWVSGANAAIFPRTLVSAESEADINLVDSISSASDNEAGFVCSSATISAATSARVLRQCIQNLNTKSIILHTEATLAAHQAAPISIAVNLGGHYARHEQVLTIEGTAADARLYGLTVANGRQEFDQRTLQVHAAGQASSNLLYKNALMGQSSTIFSGLIRVEENAQQTDAYQTNRNLQLSEEAEANSLPGLEILANDVKCSHGATTGKLDESELFYMLARGIAPAQARRLLVFGFFEEILEKVENEPLAEYLRELVHQKFDTV